MFHTYSSWYNFAQEVISLNKIFKVSYGGWHISCNVFGIRMKFHFMPKHIDTINIISDPKAGIGNRIFGIVNILNYFTPRVLNLHWDTKNWVSCKLSDIFDIETSTIINEYDSTEFIKREEKIKKQLTIVGPSHILKNLHRKNLSFKYNEIEEIDIQHFSQIFNKIKPTKIIQERIKNFGQNFNYAVQVRNNSDWNNFGRNESLENYFKEIDKIPSEEKIYLSAMNSEVAEIFKDKYGERIIELNNKNYSSMIDAVTDLYILGNSKNAIYSYGSTFGELAFWLGGAKQKVTIVGSENNWKKCF